MKFLLNKIVYIVLPLIIFTSIFISSCTTDNPIIPPPPDPGPDTASYYTWEKFITNALLFDVHVNDTNNIWISTPVAPIVFNGSGFEYIPLAESRFIFYNFSVIDKNNSFWAGMIITSPTSGYPSLIKYTNGKQKLHIVDSSLGDGNHSPSDVFAINENQAWIGISPSNYAYFFDNGKIIKYEIGFHYNPRFFYKKSDNSLYCFASVYLDSSAYLTTFKFNGAGFDSLRSDPTAYDGQPGLTEHLFICGNDLINFNHSYGTYYFTGNSWAPNNVFPGDGFYGAWKVGGISKDSLSFFSTFPHNMYNWNGTRFRKQNNFTGFVGYGALFSYYSNIINHKGRLYFTVNEDGVTSDSYLVIGKPKY